AFVLVGELWDSRWAIGGQQEGKGWLESWLASWLGLGGRRRRRRRRKRSMGDEMVLMFLASSCPLIPSSRLGLIGEGVEGKHQESFSLPAYRWRSGSLERDVAA